MNKLIKLHNEKGNDVVVVSPTLQTIILPVEVHAELLEYTRHYDTEVSGVGLVKKAESKFEVGKYNKSLVHTVTYTVTEVFLPPKQTNAYSSTEIEESAISEIITRLIAEGRNPEELKLHWHSHVNMGTFHSMTDEENYQGLDNKDFLVSLVTNKKGEVLGRVDIYTPAVVSFINVPVFVGLPDLGAVEKRVTVNIEALDRYVKEKVSKRESNVGFNSSIARDRQLISRDGKFNVDAWRRAEKVKRKVRRLLHVSDEKALKYEYCKQQTITCKYCQDVRPCLEYMDELTRRLAGEGRHCGVGDIEAALPDEVERII